MAVLRIADVVPAPGGRFIRDGEYSGEWFREQVLKPRLNEAIQAGGRLDIILDGTPGYGSSFLEEAFGGLIRSGKFTSDQLDKSMRVVAERETYLSYKKLVDMYMFRASKVSKGR